MQIEDLCQMYSKNQSLEPEIINDVSSLFIPHSEIGNRSSDCRPSTEEVTYAVPQERLAWHQATGAGRN
jgi:hypothetical protein